MAKKKLGKGEIRSLFCRQAGESLPTVFRVDGELRIVEAFQCGKALSMEDMPTSVLEWFPDFRRDEMAEALKSVLSGRKQKYRLYLPCPSYTESRWVSLEGVKREGDLWLITADATQQKLELTQLQTAAAQYAALVNNAPFVVYITLPDASLTPLFVSPRIKTLIGYEPEEIYRTPDLLVQSIHPDDWPMVSQEMRNARSRGVGYVLEYRLLDRWGNERYILDHGVPVKDSLGQVMAVEGIILDITERISLQKSLKEVESKHRAVIDQAGDAILILSLSGEVLEANPSAMEMFGISLVDDGKPQMPPTIIAMWNNMLRPILDEGKSTPVEIRLPRTDGTLIAVEVNARRIRLGRESAILVIARDISGRLRSEEELREHVRLLSLVKEAVIRLDNAGVVRYWNDSAERLFAIPRQDAMGKPLMQILSVSCVDDGERLSWERLWSLKPRGGQISVVHEAGDQGKRYLTMSITPLVDEKGAFAGVVIVAWDVTKDMEWKSRLRSVEQLVHHMGDYAFTLSLDGIVLFANKSAADAWGAPSQSALVGRHISSLFESRLPSFDSPEAFDVLRRRGGWATEVTARALSGDTFPVRLNISAVPGNGSRSAGLVMVGHDLSDTARVIDALKAQIRLLQVLHSFALRIIMTDSIADIGRIALEEMALWYGMGSGVLLRKEGGKWNVLYTWGNEDKAERLGGAVLRKPDEYFAHPVSVSGKDFDPDVLAERVILLPVRVSPGGTLRGLIALAGDGEYERAPVEEFFVAVTSILSARWSTLEKLHGWTVAAEGKVPVLQSRYMTVVESAPVGMAIFDEGGRVAVINTHACSILGCKRSEAKGKRIYDLVNVTEDRDRLEALWNGRIIAPVRIVAVDKRGRWFEGTIAPILGGDERVVGFQWVFRDISQERALAQQVREARSRLEAEREKLNQAIARIDEGVLILDESGEVVLLNPAMESLSGTRADEAIGKRVADLADRSPVWKLALEMWLQGEEVVERDLKMEMEEPALPDEIRVYRLRAVKIRDPKGEMEGVVISVHDVSKLAQVERLKLQFVSGISHELRTPLHAIRLFLHNLTRNYDALPDARKKEFLSIISEQVNTLHYLIEQLLVFSRLEAGRLKPYRIETDLRDVVNKTLQGVAQLAEEKGVNLSLKVPRTRPVMVFVDEQQTGQILRNLLDNAIKYTPAGGVVTVRVREKRKEGKAVVEVQDTGPGIPPQEMDHLFERFYRGGADNSGIPGTGLGLAIARNLAELNGGDILVKSKVGKGSTFSIVFPLWSGRDRSELR